MEQTSLTNAKNRVMARSLPVNSDKPRPKTRQPFWKDWFIIPELAVLVLEALGRALAKLTVA